MSHWFFGIGELSADGWAQIELTSPAASEQSRADCEAICKLGLKAKVCGPPAVRPAIDREERC